MSVITVEDKISVGGKCVSLPPWEENSNRLMSLWDMLRIAAHNLVQTGRILQALQMDATSIAVPQKTLEGAALGDFLEALRNLKDNCDQLSLSSTGDLVGWAINQHSSSPHTHGQMRSTVEHLSAAYQQELSRHFFAYIKPDKAKYMRSVDASIANPAYGVVALNAFPHSFRDMGLAGNCYACGFNDACVFHLMRVLEHGLSGVATVFSEPFAHENWHNIIERLESKIRKIDKGLGPDWKEQQQFYSEVACEFMFFKDAWRNHVMHGRDEYDDERTENIYNHVCQFMRHLAEGFRKQ